MIAPFSPQLLVEYRDMPLFPNGFEASAVHVPRNIAHGIVHRVATAKCEVRVDDKFLAVP